MRGTRDVESVFTENEKSISFVAPKSEKIILIKVIGYKDEDNEW